MVFDSLTDRLPSGTPLNLVSRSRCDFCQCRGKAAPYSPVEGGTTRRGPTIYTVLY